MTVEPHVLSVIDGQSADECPDPFDSPLTAETDPLLADLWDDPRDAVTINFNRGETVLVEFVLSDESGGKQRPALIWSSSQFLAARRDVVVADVTSNTTRRLLGDHRVGDWRSAGLVYPSTVTAIIRTIGRTMIRRRLGTLTAFDLAAFEALLRRALGL